MLNRVRYCLFFTTLFMLADSGYGKQENVVYQYLF
jgi:hypothetical protein